MIGIRSLQFRYRHSSTAIVPAFGAGILGRQNEKAPDFAGAFRFKLQMCFTAPPP